MKYFVFRNPASAKCHTPTKEHESLESAIDEAFRLCEQENDFFYIAKVDSVVMPQIHGIRQVYSE